MDVDGRTLLTSSGLWTVRLREPACADPARRLVVLKIDLTCGDRWYLVDLHLGGVASADQRIADVGWILDALHAWLSLPDRHKTPVLALAPPSC